jgi:hypothetical protein
MRRSSSATLGFVDANGMIFEIGAHSTSSPTARFFFETAGGLSRRV